MTGPPTPNPARSRFARLHPRAYLSLHSLVGLALSAACVWLFVKIASEVPETSKMVRVDDAVTSWLQSHGTEPGESIFLVVSLFGGPVLWTVLIVAALILAVRRDWRHLILLAVTCGGGALLNGGLKALFHRTRPSFASEFPVSSWGFPSGHAMDSLIAYGLLAYWLGSRYPKARWRVALGVIAVVGMIGFSRIYLGVHYLSDVVAGYTAGLVWLMVCISGYRFADRRQGSPSFED